MSKEQRNGSREKRDRRRKVRTPQLGYYVIVTDAKETEVNYFKGLRSSLPEELNGKLVIKVFDTDTKKLIEKCLKETVYEPQYRIPWIVFDRDEVADFDGIIKRAEDCGIEVAWSNPCFEIWLSAYLGNIQSYMNSKSCCNSFSERFAKTAGVEYRKSDKLLYEKLKKHGNEERAIERARARYNTWKDKAPSEAISCTTVYKLLEEIIDCCKTPL